MRSVYTRVLCSTAAILVFTLVALLLLVRSNSYSTFQSGGPYSGLLSEQVAQAQHAFESGGGAGLAAQLKALEKLYPTTQRYLLDRSGRDLETGADLSRLLRSANSRFNRFDIFAPVYVGQRSADGRYVLLFTPSSRNLFRTLLVYYALAFVAIGLLCGALAVQFVSPLSRLTQIVQQFGAGDLQARIRLKRRDELGELANTFDNMAERIENLLIAERRLLQDISHELRSPLARLSFAAELGRTSPDRKGAMARVQKEIDRLEELIERLLQVTSAQGDPAALHPMPINLGDIVLRVVEDCQFEADARECILRVSGDAGAQVLGDSELLRRAIENVIRNAIRHAPADTAIEIDLNMAGDECQLVVRDFGPGVPNELLRSIFKPFFRVDGSRDIATGGIGLGLSIVERAVALHHGRVWAENAQPGLQVTIQLPADHGRPTSPLHSQDRGKLVRQQS